MSAPTRTFRDVPLDGGLFPSAAQMLLLQAALGSGVEAQSAFHKWSSIVDLDAEFGWEALRLMPLVYHNLAALNTEHALMGRLKGVYRRAWYQAHTLFRRTGSAIAALASANVDVLMSKGATLAHEYYRNIALRPMTDVDICVRRADVARAIGVLEALGWSSTSELTADYRRFRHAMQFRHPDGGEIDLHWRLLAEAKDETLNELFWRDAEPIEFGGARVLQLGPTNLLLQQIVHGMRWNPETPVRWIPDAVMITRARGADIDWHRLHTVARKLRVTSRLSLGLTFLVDHFAFEAPPGLLSELGRRRPALIERLENRVLLRSDEALGTGIGPELVRGLVEFTRVVDPVRHPLRGIYEYPHYLRLKWQLDSRLDIPAFVARGVVRRLKPNLSTVSESVTTAEPRAASDSSAA